MDEDNIILNNGLLIGYATGRGVDVTVETENIEESE